MIPEDIVGHRFGKLVVVERVPMPENRKTPGTYYRCKCDCGNGAIVARRLIINGRTHSCGCIRKHVLAERARTQIKRHKAPKTTPKTRLQRKAETIRKYHLEAL